MLKMRLSDVLMDLRAEKLFSAHWTESIDDEFLRNLSKVHGIAAASARRRLNAMKARCPEWEVFMGSEDFQAVPSSVDPKDRHVAAAALALRHAADQDAEEAPATDYQVILLTENIKDFAPSHMRRLGVQVLQPGAFLDKSYQAAPQQTSRAVMRAVSELSRPPYSLAELLDVLRTEGARALVAGMSRELEIE